MRRRPRKPPQPRLGGLAVVLGARFVTGGLPPVSSETSGLPRLAPAVLASAAFTVTRSARDELPLTVFAETPGPRPLPVPPDGGFPVSHRLIKYDSISPVVIRDGHCQTTLFRAIPGVLLDNRAARQPRTHSPPRVAAVIAQTAVSPNTAAGSSGSTSNEAMYGMPTAERIPGRT